VFDLRAKDGMRLMKSHYLTPTIASLAAEMIKNLAYYESKILNAIQWQMASMNNHCKCINADRGIESFIER